MGSQFSRASEAASIIGSQPGLLLLLTCATALVYIGIRKQKARYPPGPRGWPIVGNAFEVPKEHEWLTYEQWSRDFNSDILYYSSWGNSFVVLNSLEAATDLLERRSALYADRPRMPMLNDLCGFAWDMGLMPYADDWKLSRRLFTQHFRPTETPKYHDEEVRCARELLRDVLTEPATFSDHVRLLFGKLIMSITYGIDVRTVHDPYIIIAQKALNAVNMTGNVGTYLVDSIPLLKYVPEWFPGATFQKEAREWKVDVEAMVNKPYDSVKKSLREGTARPSMLQALFEELGDDLTDQKELAVKSATGTAYEAGSETTWSAALSVGLVMLLYPEVQRKVHEEIDRVVGRERFPEFSDQDSLPYTTAVCREVLRWAPPLPLAVMHRLTQEDVYRGYHIPGGSTIVLNSWAILRDENVWPNPNEFSPERFLNASGELDREAPQAAFGFGRRGCAGLHMAQDSLWMTAVSLLWAFDIEKAVDEKGQPIEVTAEYTFGVVSYPKPYRCTMKPRSHGIEGLVASVPYGYGGEEERS